MVRVLKNGKAFGQFTCLTEAREYLAELSNAEYFRRKIRQVTEREDIKRVNEIFDDNPYTLEVR